MNDRPLRDPGLALRGLPAVLLVWSLALFTGSAVLAVAPEPASSAGGMVVTPHPAATRAGVAMLEAGGNAVDAAVAAAFAIGVVQPQSTGIGGGGFLLIRLPSGEIRALDARETAPAASRADMYTREGVPPRSSLLGGLASGTPGLVAGLVAALEAHGSLPLATVMAPAIRLADDGYEVGGYQARWIQRLNGEAEASGFAALLKQALETRFAETARIQLPAPPVTRTTVLRQPELATTLRAIAAQGPRAFYEGPIAQAIAKAAHDHGGILSVSDLAHYSPRWREPVRGRFRGYEVASFPPPSSGGVAIVEILNILEGFDLAALGAGSSAAIHRTTEAMKLAFADRAAYLGDPDFVDVPVARLTDTEYAAQLRRRINPPRWRRAPWKWGPSEIAIDVSGPGFAVDDHGTAHLSTTDAAGYAVAFTGTINGPYGSFVTVPGTGILLNNQMDDFVTDPAKPNLYGLVGSGDANLVAPLKRPLSSMSPTIVSGPEGVRFVAGSNGGPRIITSTLLALLNVLEYGMDVSEAVCAPRYHHQWRPDVLTIERGTPADVVEALRARGHSVELVDGIVIGVEAIAIDPETGLHTGSADPRRDGLAMGPR